MKPIIQVESLSKRYRLGQRQEAYETLRDSLAEAVRAPLARLRRGRNAGASIWALRDVSFDVHPGEMVGIIGHNGAGKSTLLKILSRITEPTSGQARLYGRVASLLEVGTGFHPELTGRENVFLNGAILGMRRAEIERLFDEIVAFAEVEQFLDTPVKRYSSGMLMRLAFAVAAHLEPEILIVDEVLAVGDAAFQRKCLSKMQTVGRQGRTVLFVSHNMPAVTRLCERAIMIDGGRVLIDGPSASVVGSYLSSHSGTAAAREWPDASTAPGNEVVRLVAVRVRAEDGQVGESLDIRRAVGVEVEYEVLKPGLVLIPNLHFFNEEGIYVFTAGDCDPAWRKTPRPAGRFSSTAWVPGNFLSEGMLFVGAAITTPDPMRVHCYERDAVAFQVVDSLEGDSVRGDWGGPIPGVIRPMLRWTTRFGAAAAPARETVSETAAAARETAL
jgi:lipopolysaccharide transport system ATP-binding protein